MGVVGNTAIRHLVGPAVGAAIGVPVALAGLAHEKPGHHHNVLWWSMVPLGIALGAASNPVLGRAVLEATSAGHRQLGVALRATEGTAAERFAGIAHAMTSADLDGASFRKAARALHQLAGELPRTTDVQAGLADELLRGAARATRPSGFLATQNYGATGRLVANADLFVALDDAAVAEAAVAVPEAAASSAGALRW